ncbi:MAG TPA: arylsulfotransferase family protein [Solirubrobacteraceae bacterium]|nr:arylsulfotransferase family protein [Solirubrobacteraceae bacterium]
MSRRGLIIPAVAIVAWVTIGIVLGTGSFSKARPPLGPSGASPTCLPASYEHDATLPGTSVSVSPAPGTVTANPRTQISFQGTPVTSIHDVAVVGGRSGYHYGHLSGYFQGDGGSFVPYKAFAAGERVTVRAALGAAGSSQRVSFGFRVATPYSTAGVAGFPNPPAPAASVQSFVTQPALHPPLLSVTTPDRDPGAGDVLMTVGPGPGQYGPLIFTAQGRLVWFGRPADGASAENLSVQRYEGAPHLTWWQGEVLQLGFGEGENIVMDRNYQTVARVRAGNGFQADLHDFQLASGEVAYLPVYNLMRCDLSAVGGKRNGVIVDTAVQAIDVKTGLVRSEWHSLDHVDVRESHAPVPDSASPWDYFHLNSIDPEPNGDLLISARSTWAAYQLQRGSGEVLWRLGGKRSSFTLGPGAQTAWQHDARLQPDGTISLFDNGSAPRIHYESRALRLALDTRRHSARVVSSHTHPSPLLADSQGDAQNLPGGRVVIGWGAVPTVSEHAASGGLLFDAHLPPGTSSYRAFRFPWSGQPLTAPAVSATVLGGDSTAVFASWNGATEVVSWRVLAGSDASSLTARASMPASGFESSVTFPHAYAYVAVQALDHAARVLSSSAATRVRVPPPPAKAG